MMFGQFRSDFRLWRHGTIPARWVVLSLAYCLVRRFVVGRVDPNEDFNCVQCCSPVLRRDLFCSMECAVMDEAEKL